MYDYEWEVKSVSLVTTHMVVRYAPVDKTLKMMDLNIPLPDKAVDLAKHIEKFAPVQEWIRSKVTDIKRQHVEGIVGQRGSVVVHQFPVPPITDIRQVGELPVTIL